MPNHRESLPSSNTEDVSSESGKLSLSRRGFLGLGAAGVGGMGVFLEYLKEKRQQAKGVDRVGDVLRNEKESATLRINKKELTHDQFLELMHFLVSDGRIRKEEVAALLEGYSDMVEVEEGFGKGFNSLRALENVEPYVRKATGGHVVTANSFGYGQISPETARLIAVKNGEKLLSRGLLTDKQLKELSDPGIAKEKIVDTLKLKDDENIIYGVLIFFDGYKHYGTNRQGRFNPEHTVDPRTFNLAVASYSGKLETPRAAKIQTYLNEMLIADPQLRREVIKRLAVKGMVWPENKLVDIDGDLGKETLALMREISNMHDIDIPFPPELAQKPVEDQEELRMDAMQTWLNEARGKWNERVLSFIDAERKQVGKEQNGALAELISRRYHTATAAYHTLKKMVPEKSANELFFDFVHNRGSGFTEIIKSRKSFDRRFNGVDYNTFIERLLKNAKGLISFDERYSGYIPTAYGKPRNIVANPKNILERVILSHDLHPDDPARIGLFPPREYRRKPKK